MQQSQKQTGGLQQQKLILKTAKQGGQEDMSQIHLPKVGENKLVRIIRDEMTYLLMERAGELKTIHEERWSVCIEQKCVVYIVPCSLWVET